MPFPCVKLGKIPLNEPPLVLRTFNYLPTSQFFANAREDDNLGPIGCVNVDFELWVKLGSQVDVLQAADLNGEAKASEVDVELMGDGVVGSGCDGCQ